MKKLALFLIAAILGICSAGAQNKVEINGILPDSAAKTGTWTEWQTVKSATGTDIAQYRIRLASADKFISNSVECKYEVEVKNLVDGVMFVDLTYSYYQTLSGKSKWESGERRGTITKKNKTWDFEFMAFNDKEDKQERSEACADCDMSYKLIFNWK